MDARITGSQFLAFHVCPTQLWLLSKQITMSHESELMAVGKEVHKGHYPRKAKEFSLGRTKIDFITTSKGVEVWEVKKSSSFSHFHEWQLKFYLYLLEKREVPIVRGVLAYPEERKAYTVRLSENDRRAIRLKLRLIRNILKRPTPPEPEWKSYCKKCSYLYLCWS